MLSRNTSSVLFLSRNTSSAFVHVPYHVQRFIPVPYTIIFRETKENQNGLSNIFQTQITQLQAELGRINQPVTSKLHDEMMFGQIYNIHKHNQARPLSPDTFVTLGIQLRCPCFVNNLQNCRIRFLRELLNVYRTMACNISYTFILCYPVYFVISGFPKIKAFL